MAVKMDQDLGIRQDRFEEIVKRVNAKDTWVGPLGDGDTIPAHMYVHKTDKGVFYSSNKTPPEEDTDYHPVRRPSHYNQTGIECIDAIEASMSPLEFMGYCKGNAMKYMWRYRYKGAMSEDLGKHDFYSALLTQRVKEEENANGNA